MATRPPPAAVPSIPRRPPRILLIIAAIVVVLFLGGSRLIDFYVNWLWYGEVGFRSVFSTVLFTRTVQFVLGGLLIGGLVWLSMWLATASGPCSCPCPAPRTRSPATAR